MADQDLLVPLGRKDSQEELALQESLAGLDRLGLKGHLDQLVPKEKEEQRVRKETLALVNEGKWVPQEFQTGLASTSNNNVPTMLCTSLPGEPGYAKDGMPGPPGPQGRDLLWRYLTEHDPKYEGRKKLKISGRELLSVPTQVFGLEQLQEIGRLRSLTCLYMDSNNLKKIPAEIGTLSRLERLTLSNNSLSSLPAEMGVLQRRHSLHLANNSLAELPAALCQLRSLTFLDVSDNKIDTIPSSIRHLEKLETLLLLFNSLESLPKDVCLLRNLHTLWLGNNHLQSLPAASGDLVNLDWGYNYCSCNFEGNPLERPPPEICSRGPKGIKDYFSSLCRIWKTKPLVSVFSN
ncbi:Leucine-rich repeat-containing protein 39 [Lonchura striata]|uniref:Leucine-rich repeat-containing protein 39 n=1 Tax=Lonchura striata TaxID=40157 RepID=A0A218UML1_9PASE|nr:Leucine-rich repeat-containing protein 39 [Lonchura striata domestica]